MPLTSLSQQNTTSITCKILARLPLVSCVNIYLHDRNSHQRSVIESFILSKFKERSSANVQYLLPYILSLHCNERVFAAAGIHLAESGPLYLENYLRLPIEQEIGMRFKTAIPRESIIEIGNLVSTWRGSSRLLFVLLSDLLSRIDREWIVFTATREVGHLLKKMNFTLFHLADAGVDMTRNDKDQRGNYYDDKPKMIFCHIPGVLSALRQNTLMNSSMLLFSDRLQELADQWKIKSG